MYCVTCPECGSNVEIPDVAVGTERTDLWNTVQCWDCGTGFDYEEEDVRVVPDDTPTA